MSKVAIITGSSSGVGKEAACSLAADGFHVVYACRNEEKAKAVMAECAGKVPGCKMTFLELDTGKMKSVKTFAEAFLSKFDRLDVLVNNAGCGYFLKDQRVTEDGLEAFFATNFLGAFLLTKLLKDILKRSKGRVVNVTSIEHWEGSYRFEKVTEKTQVASYATSKLMLMLMAFALPQREGIPAAAVNPGGVNSGIWWYLRGWKKTVWEFIAPLILLTTSQGAQTTVHAATVETLPAMAYFSPYKQRSWCPYHSDLLGPYNGPTIAIGCPAAYKKESIDSLWDFAEEKVKPFL
mmetsp:Transcript_154/g.232  ORF Transcript_154/g.232 Transcript_154/m.232 type:complete len:293 (-) Transcript_154:137-1015(-)